MLYWLRRWTPQPLAAIVASTLAVAGLLWFWRDVSQVSTRDLAVALFLLVGGIIADLFPIHLRNNTKAYLSTIPLYLTAVLLPPPLAATVAGMVVLGGELLAYRQRRLDPLGLATAAGRWTIIALLGSLVAHSPLVVIALPAALVAAALVMYITDLLSVTLEIVPISGEPPLFVIAANLREGGALEGIQYMLGILGALAAYEEIGALALLVVPGVVAYFAFKRIKEMQANTRRFLEELADRVDERDPYTGGHSRRVADLTARLLHEMGLIGIEAEMIVSAARVHDIGKLTIPDDILRKPDHLTAAEEAVMQPHAKLGAEMLARYRDFTRGKEFVLHHHERWDGKGYPAQLKEMRIPLGARVIAVADSYDAMTSNRPYRRALTPEQAARVLAEDGGKQWDPNIVLPFLRVIAPVTREETVSAEAAGRVNSPASLGS